MGHFENFLYPYLAANHTKETPKEIEKWALARDWISSLLLDELELETLERDWKIMTPKWSKDITLIFGRLIACEFWNKMDQGELEFSVEAALVEAQNRYHYKEYPNFKAIARIITTCASKVHGRNPVWRKICATLESLCHQIGIPNPSLHPAQNIAEIREYYRIGTLHGESILRTQIDDLKIQLEKQKQIIASLSFRHVLENLPGPDAKGASATARWQNFWNECFDAAVPSLEKKKGKTPKQYPIPIPDPSHPLAKLMITLDGTSRDAVKNYGSLLYNGLSANIHSFHIDVDVPVSNMIEKSILEALKPICMVPNDQGNPGKDIDWEAERARLSVQTPAGDASYSGPPPSKGKEASEI
ncbi:hypothetical protein BKA61DRAFT_601912 [Leptodontidium sp. MPI-SDFR-AT-0119]|nr:hypothetical protein BKA61DRAFT_601912 [Leptodontidium sp. MPI-SDFR-AT-0119]